MPGPGEGGSGRGTIIGHCGKVHIELDSPANRVPYIMEGGASGGGFTVVERTLLIHIADDFSSVSLKAINCVVIVLPFVIAAERFIFHDACMDRV